MCPTVEHAEPRYTLRETRRGNHMIDKLVRDEGFPDDWWFPEDSFGPFPSREAARQFMLQHEGRP